MTEVNALTDEILSPMRNEGCTVQYQYADDKAKLPAVTYYGLINKESFRADNTEMSEICRVQIDVWAVKRSQMSEASIRVNELMQGALWQRELCRDMPRETEEQVYHRTMRFAKEIWG